MKSHVKHRFRRLLLPLVMLVVCLLPVSKVSAAEDTLELNDIWVNGTIAEGDGVDYYGLTVPEAGFLKIDYQGYSISSSVWEIWDEGLTRKYTGGGASGSSANNPVTSTKTIALETGKYKIKIHSTWSNTGDYRVRASFTPANNNEIEPNEPFEHAMPLAVDGKVTGFLSMDDRVDFYKIQIPYRQNVTVHYMNYTSDISYTIYNSDQMEVKSGTVYGGSAASPKDAVYADVLEPGIYYIRITPKWGDAYGCYSISWSKVRVKLDIENVTLNEANVYAGKAVTPKVTVTSNGATLVEGVDYRLSWSNNTKIGWGKVTVTGIGDYDGTISKVFSINLKKGSSFTKGNYTYKITNASETNAAVTLTKVKSSAKSITVPSTVSYGGVKLKVTEIGSKACQNGKATKVTIGKNVTKIGSRAFYKCSKLKTVTIQSKSLKSVGKECFKGIYKKAKIKVPSAQYKKYTKLLANKGQAKTVKIRK